jgi:hypothetical protein
LCPENVGQRGFKFIKLVIYIYIYDLFFLKEIKVATVSILWNLTAWFVSGVIHGYLIMTQIWQPCYVGCLNEDGGGETR